MPTENTVKGILDAPYQDFIASFLPLYSGPCVKVRVGSAGHEYELSKAILCKQSLYFAKTFQGGFREGQDQSTTLTEVEGVVTQRSFEMLVQWLYLGRVLFSESSPAECITATIEFVRLADMCGVYGMETLMAEHIKAIILANPAPEHIVLGRDPDTNTYCLLGQHITSAALLPDGHAIRKVLAIASVEGYIRRDKHKFLKEICESPGFAADLLLVVKETLKTVNLGEPHITFKNPCSGMTLAFVTKNV
ncbi:Uncharacterized protein BP5553_04737 [Venustampulla echinocandica]|uniref:BTB domain-containing protein n=1 Tax=Venustampulla echinocandica TaxID=2656787 RepID=A0A370TP62_9HELO|nr:Uncharacterized protein BP5553_04737 [Venustampulla echinocandica]RDL37304.1 Uncharacterized protein BP5553_04737 [Venustampulla echinocandica]